MGNIKWRLPILYPYGEHHGNQQRREYKQAKRRGENIESPFDHHESASATTPNFVVTVRVIDAASSE